MKRETFESGNSESDYTLIFGVRPVIEAISSGKELERIFIQRDLHNPQIRELRNLLTENNLTFQMVPVEKLNRITRKNHQGVVGFLSLVSYGKTEDVVPGLFEKVEFPLVILLDRITDVRNFGAICRTAEFTGVGAVIIPEKGAAQINGDAIKASAGALNRIVVCREPNLKETIQYLKDSGFAIVGCTEKGTTPVFDFQFDSPVCIILGSEEDGISPEYLKRCDARLAIPRAGSTASLNVSVAAGMILYEVMRQRAQIKS